MPNELMQRGADEAESEMLPQDPPPWFVRSISWLLISMFAVALLVAIFVKLPETVSCPFVLISSGGADPIQSPRLAVVARVAVNEGDKVTKGEPLFLLRSDEIRDWGTQLGTLQEDLHIHEDGLTKSDAAYVAQSKIKDAEISQSQSEVEFRKNYDATSNQLVKRMERLVKSGGISEIEMIQHRLEAAQADKDLSVSERTLQQVNLEREQMETEHARSRAENLAEIEKLKLRLSALQGDLENSQQNLLAVRAPYAGVVISLAQRNVGSVVQNGQELCQLSATNTKPRARLTLSEAGLPSLARNQPVRLFLDAFPYQRYGVVNATLDWISPAAVISTEGPHFVGLASLDPTSPGRRPLKLRVGMTGEARIMVGQRTLIEYAFEPIRQLRENMRD
ncbi:MAG TPA: HlyD family efflux transporter periplasmic adaptor subunit [Chthoniobacterales bacterium]